MVRITSQPCGVCNAVSLMALIVAPDMLVSPTSIVSSLSCERATVLSHFVESGGIKHPSAVLGTLKHEVFEAAMVNSDFTREFLKLQMKEIVQKNFENIISVGLTFDAALLEIQSVMESMVAWANTYLDRTNFKLDQREMSSNKKAFQQGGHVLTDHVEGAQRRHALVTKVSSTEQYVASTIWGMKGFIDACLEVHFTNIEAPNKRVCRGSDTNQKGQMEASCPPDPRDSQGQKIVVPFELKTGKKQFKALEHQAQLMLYTLLMRETQGCSVTGLAPSADSSETGNGSTFCMLQNGGWKSYVVGNLSEGLLLYLPKEERLPMECIRADDQFLIPLLHARNNVAAYIAYNAGINVAQPPLAPNDQLKHARSAATLCLPRVVRDTRTCSYCYNKVSCAVHLKSFDIEDCANEVPWLSSVTAHLGDAHMEFFQKWNSLLNQEVASEDIALTTQWYAAANCLIGVQWWFRADVCLDMPFWDVNMLHTPLSRGRTSARFPRFIQKSIIA
jgi:hypothetical protein